MVDKDGIQVFVKKFFWDSPFKFVESKIQKLELRQTKNQSRELTSKAIVAEIQLV